MVVFNGFLGVFVSFEYIESEISNSNQYLSIIAYKLKGVAHLVLLIYRIIPPRLLYSMNINLDLFFFLQVFQTCLFQWFKGKNWLEIVLNKSYNVKIT